MERAEEYRRNAEEAERRAKRAVSPLERDEYLKIGKSWRELAEEADRAARRGL